MLTTTPLIALLLAFRFSLAQTVNNTDDWTTIDRTEIFRELDTCAQGCVRNVNARIWDVGQRKFCQSWGCVCSNSTHGENFVNGESNVTSCATESCGDETKGEVAKRAFGELCLVQVLNSTRPQTKNGTTFCAKFIINACLDINGTRNEDRCDTRLKPHDWQLYRGIAEQRSCKASECLCQGPNFDVMVDIAMDAGRRFCAMRPSTKSLPNKEADDMLNVLASYCFSYGFAPRNFTYTYTGAPPGSERKEGWSAESKAQLGVAAAALLVSLIALYPAVRLFWLAKKGPESKRSSVSSAHKS